MGVSKRIAVVVPHVHWDREWYEPFEVMRFYLVRFMDDLIETLETDPELPVFVLDGQAVILEDYLQVRPSQRARIQALVGAGRLRPGPFYVQPDEFHVSGEALVRNLLIGCRVAAEYGWVMREGYLPDTFGHVHQLPQILRGFGITTFYAMRGFGQELDKLGSQFRWRAPDGSDVHAEWLSESYSNAPTLRADAATTCLHHGALVHYDSLDELLGRLSNRSPTGVLLLLNGGDHLRIQQGLPDLVRSLNKDVEPRLRLGGLEEFHDLLAERPLPEHLVTGELRHGRRHDVFDGIASTRTPLKRQAERAESLLCTAAERLDAIATLTDGRSSKDLLHHAWRELIKNHAHDSICGCSVDDVHADMETRLRGVEQIAGAVAEDAVGRIARSAVSGRRGADIEIAVVNPSGFARCGNVQVSVIPDIDTPLGERVFGWTQGERIDWSGYRLYDRHDKVIPFTVRTTEQRRVIDPLNRRKEIQHDVIEFFAADVPALDAAAYRLGPARPGDSAEPVAGTRRSARTLDNGVLTAEIAADGVLTLRSPVTGRVITDLLELLDEGDAGDEYGFGALPWDRPVSSRDSHWSVGDAPDPYTVLLTGSLAVPAALASDRRARGTDVLDLPVELRVSLLPGEDLVRITVTVDNRIRDHRLRLRLPTGLGAGTSLAESAFGVIRRISPTGRRDGWQEPPSGALALRRFLATEDDTDGLQILTEGLHEYRCDADGTVDLTVLRAVGWLTRTDHPAREHRVGPELRTPHAQCPGRHSFRLGLRPYHQESGRGHLYRAAERFAAPLRAAAIQGQDDLGRRVRPAQLGLAAEPTAVVLSAVKATENGDGVIVRVFNCDDGPVIAELSFGFPVGLIHRCDLQEQPTELLGSGADGVIRFPLAGGQIGTVRLTTSRFKEEPTS